jgi:hypothetical protein
MKRKIKQKIMNLIINGLPTSKGAMAKRIIRFSIFFMAFYAVSCLFLLYKGVQLDSTLTTCVYTSFGAELGMLMVKRLFNPKDNQTEESGIDTTEKI